jgi:hypothetical protein
VFGIVEFLACEEVGKDKQIPGQIDVLGFIVDLLADA